METAASTRNTTVGDPQILVESGNDEGRDSQAHDHDLQAQARQHGRLRNVLATEGREVAFLG